MINFKKLVASMTLAVVLVVGAVTLGAGVNADNITKENKNIVAEFLGVAQIEAYTFSATGGIVIEDSDVTDVTESALIGVSSLYQILKFIGLSILIGVSVFIVNKIFSIAKIGS